MSRLLPDAILPPRGSLVRRLVFRIAARISVVVAIASLLGYWHVERGLEQQAVDSLERYIAERRARESLPFEAAQLSLDFFAERLREALGAAALADPSFRFMLRFARRDDGTLRTQRPLFEREDVTGFIGKHVLLDDMQKRVLVAATDLLNDLGPTVRDRFANLYVVTPQNAVVMYWPGQPWGLDASDWEIYGKLRLASGAADDDVVVLGDAAEAAGEGVRWSGVYFDYGVNRWVVSATRPVVVDGRAVAHVGHDVLLDDLIARVLQSDLPGGYSMLLTEAGDLVAHPHFMEAIHASGGELNVAETGRPELGRIHQAALAADRNGEIVRNAEDGLLIAATRLSGPDWLLLTVFPKSVVVGEARSIALLILVVGITALLMELVILSGSLRSHLGGPLVKLSKAAESVGAGNFDVELDTARDDELGALARTFRKMIAEINVRRTALRTRNAELAKLAEELQHELEERRRAESELARHRELNALLNAIDYGVLFLDAELNIRLANKAYLRIWRSEGDFERTSISMADSMERSRRLGLYRIPDGAWQAYKARRIAQVRAGDFGPEEMMLADGTLLQYQVVALPGGGRMLTYFDLTRRKQIEDELRRHLTGMEASMDGMALLDREGRFTYVNAAHAETYGYRSPSEMVGLRWQDVYDGGEMQRFRTTIIPEIYRSGKWRGEAVGRRADGRTFPQEISLALTPDNGFVSIVRDVTARREREAALDRAMREAREANLAKSRFLASISHELRTPMNAIIGFTRIVRRTTADRIPQRQSDNLDKILASAEHLLGLINDVLDISKIEAGRVEVLATAFPPDTVIDDCLRTVEPMVPAGVRLHRTGRRIEGTVVSDVAKLRQILLNLLGNAAKFTHEGEIAVSAAIEGDDLVVRVADTGIGIPAEALGTIFEEFGQHRDPSAKQAKGTGLGLTISRRLARLLGGDIEVASEVGVGSVFTCRIPARAGAAEPLAKTG